MSKHNVIMETKLKLMLLAGALTFSHLVMPVGPNLLPD